VVTNDGRLAELCRSFANQGRSAMGPWLQHDRLGQNYRLGEMAAALGRSQLARLDRFIERRARVARHYGERLAALAGMEREGVPCRGYFAPVHTQPYIRERFGDLRGSLPRTEAIARRTLALPFHNDLQPDEIDRVLGVLKRNL